jgi:hypothetical protein
MAWAKAFLRQIVPNAARDDPVCVFTREKLAIGSVVRVMRSTIGVAFESNGGHRDYRTLGNPPFKVVIFRLALGLADPPAVIVNHDRDVIRVVEGRRCAIECSVVKVPIRRSDLPNKLRKVVAVFVVAEHAAFGGKIILVPPLELGLRGQRAPLGFLAGD